MEDDLNLTIQERSLLATAADYMATGLAKAGQFETAEKLIALGRRLEVF